MKNDNKKNSAKPIFTFLIIASSVYFSTSVWLNKNNRNIEKKDLDSNVNKNIINSNPNSIKDYNSSDKVETYNFETLEDLTEFESYNGKKHFRKGLYKYKIYENNDEITLLLNIINIQDEGFIFSYKVAGEYIQDSFEDKAIFNSDYSAICKVSNCDVLYFEWDTQNKLVLNEEKCNINYIINWPQDEMRH